MKKIVILGAGESGIGAALLAHAKGYEVFVSDFGTIEEKFKAELNNSSIPFEQNGHSIDRILKADLVIKSPGIPNESFIIKEINKVSISIRSEVEFAAQYTSTPIIAITGSNGKTTTTLLIAHILKMAGKNVEIGGNIGKSFARLVLQSNPDYFVLEISSFQLDDIDKFKPKVAIILNITADHLDRYHNDIQQYANSKMRIVKNQTKEDYFIYCNDDSFLIENVKAKAFEAKTLSYSIEDDSSTAFIQGDKLLINYPNKIEIDKSSLSLKGEHNLSNALAASLTSNILNIDTKVIMNSLSTFNAVEHRLEEVITLNGITFINDSKATNVDAAYYALKSIEKPIVWIVGGVDKGNDYSVLIDLAKENVHTIICLGKDNSKIRLAFSPYVDNIIQCDTLKDAVKNAYKMANHGDYVLLSPACASFDLFKNYEDRGNQFKEQVKHLSC